MQLKYIQANIQSNSNKKHTKDIERRDLYLKGAQGRSLGGFYPKTYDPRDKAWLGEAMERLWRNGKE